MKIVERIRGILRNPSEEWNTIKNEEISIRDILTTYVLPLALIPTFCVAAGYLIFGIYLNDIKQEIPLHKAAYWAAVSYIQNVIAVLVGAFVIDGLSLAFRTKKDMNASMKVIAFSYTPVWIAGIFYLIPQVNFFVAAGWIYMMFLMYKGLNTVKDVPKERVIGYEVLVYCVMMVLYYFMNLIFAYTQYLILGH